MRFNILNLEPLSGTRLYAKVVKKIDVNKRNELMREVHIKDKYKAETAEATEHLNDAVKKDGGTIPDKPDGVGIKPNDALTLKGDGFYIETEEE